jgi:hypothetical protein
MEQQEFLERLFNKLIVDRLNYNPVTNIEINICEINSLLDKRSGINVQLKRDGYIGMEVRKCLRNIYGVTEDESEILWNMIRLHLKKLDFVENACEVLYEDYIQYESDPYRFDGYDLKNLDDFIDFMGEIGYGSSQGDPHSNERINFLNILDRSDYEYIQSELFGLIESSWEPDDEYRTINESDGPYGGKMSNVGLLYSKLEDMKRHGIHKGDKKYDDVLKQIEQIKKSGEKYTEPKKGFLKSKIDDYKDRNRYDEFSDFEKKVYDYQKGYDNIDKRLLQYTNDFISYYNNVYPKEVGNMLYTPKLTNKEITKFLTKHYREDIYPKLTGLYKNKILTHGTKDYKSLDVIDIDKHITTGTGNQGHFGRGLYLTSSRNVGKHYGKTQPLVLHNIQNPFFIIPGNKNYYGSHDFKGVQCTGKLDFNSFDVSIIPKEDDDNQKILNTIEKFPNYKMVSYGESIPELDKMWKQNAKKLCYADMVKNLVSYFGISDELSKKLANYTEYSYEESPEFASLTGAKSLDKIYKQNKYDLIVTNKNTSGEGLDRFMDAEVIVKEPTSVVSIFPTLNAIMKSDGNSIHRDLTSSNIHNESHKRIKKILREYDDEDKEFDPLNDDLVSKEQYEKVFKIFDSNPDKIFEVLKVFGFKDNELGETYQKEYNFIHKYLTEYKDRTPKYIRIVFDANDLSDMFVDDRDYDIQKMVKGYLGGDWDYEPIWECMDFDSWLFDKIDESNIKTLKKHYLKNLEGEESEDDFMEFVESEFGSEIGCAASDAQYAADIDYLHSDFENGIEDYLSGFGGKLQRPVDKEGNTGFGLEYVADLEIGELTQSPFFQDSLLGILEHEYPDSFYDIYNDIIESEKEGWSSEYNYFLPEDKISINTDKHFRYGGAGNIDWSYFNEILSDKLSYY